MNAAEFHHFLNTHEFVFDERCLERAVIRLLLLMGLKVQRLFQFEKTSLALKIQHGINGFVKIMFSPLRINLASLHPTELTA
jgi:hypothetical protein